LAKELVGLVNHKDAPIVGKYLINGEVFFYSGSTVRFQSHVALVEACLLSPPGFSSFPEKPPVRWRATYADLVPFFCQIGFKASSQQISLPYS
jgi:hypothetical protein